MAGGVIRLAQILDHQITTIPILGSLGFGKVGVIELLTHQPGPVTRHRFSHKGSSPIGIEAIDRGAIHPQKLPQTEQGGSKNLLQRAGLPYPLGDIEQQTAEALLLLGFGLGGCPQALLLQLQGQLSGHLINQSQTHLSPGLRILAPLHSQESPGAIPQRQGHHQQ